MSNSSTQTANDLTSRFMAPPRRRNEGEMSIIDNDAQVSDASVAASELSDLLRQCTSFKLGAIASLSSPLRYQNNDYTTTNEENKSIREMFSPDPLEWLRDSEHKSNDAVKSPINPSMKGFSTSQSTSNRQIDGKNALPFGKDSRIRTAAFHRADTPVMSNSQRLDPVSTDNTRALIDLDKRMELDCEKVSGNQFPWPVRINAHASVKVNSSNGGDIPSQTFDCKGYFDSVCKFVASKRKMTNRSSDEQESFMNRTYYDESHFLNSSGSEEKLIDLEFLSGLSKTAREVANGGDNFDKHSNRCQVDYESYFWSLLASLRSIGLIAILWEDDKGNTLHHQKCVQEYIQQLAAEFVMSSPKDLITELQKNLGNSSAPLLLKRRQTILKWIERVFDQKLPQSLRKAPARKSEDSSFKNGLKDESLIIQGFTLDSQEIETALLAESLDLILAGRLHDAQQHVRNKGSTWRSGLWDGSRPFEFTCKAIGNVASKTLASTGNPNRALWRRVMWKMAEVSLSSIKASSCEGNDYEAAIAAILSCHIRSGLDNPVLNKSWEQGLFVVYRAVHDRIEDELLYHQRINRTQLKKNSDGHVALQGIGLDRYEREQLQATSEIACFDDFTIVELVNGNPRQHETLRKESNLMIRAISSVLVGKGAIVEFMTNCLPFVFHERIDSSDIAHIRFLTHFALYLDSLLFCYSASNLAVKDTVSKWKNELVILYMQLLASNEELCHMIIVYASLLPENTILEVLPSLLVQVDSYDQRRIVVEHLHEFLSSRKQGLDLEVVRRVVQLVLAGRSEDAVETECNSKLSKSKIHNEEVPDTVSWLDMKKMKAIFWLTFRDEHSGDAIVIASTILRRFLLEGLDENESKSKEAHLFITDVFPLGLLEKAKTLLVTQNEICHEAPEQSQQELLSFSTSKIIVDRAISDFLAIQKYLLAMDALNTWIEIISASPTGAKPNSDDLEESSSRHNTSANESSSNAAESSMLARMAPGCTIENMRRTMSKVITAADTVEKLLWEILTYEGGWLMTDHEDQFPFGATFDSTTINDENLLRGVELNRLRSNLLPKTLIIYGRVCLQTAEWLFSYLNSTIEKKVESGKNRTTSHALGDGYASFGSELDFPNLINPDAITKLFSQMPPCNPRYWSKKVLKVGSISASDTYGIGKAFSAEDFQRQIQLIADATVYDFFYSRYLP